MIQSINHIDKIARIEKRDVIYIEFDQEEFPDYDYDKWLARKSIMDWCQSEDITVIPCAGLAREIGFESYRGQLYINIPYDETDSRYQKLRDHLEYEDGSPRIAGLKFLLVPLDLAIKNAHHDEPGFWENWP